MVDRSTTKKLVVLSRPLLRGFGHRERFKKTLALDGLLRNPFENGRHFDTERIKHRWHDVDHVQVLVAHLARSVCAGRPVHDQWVGDTTFVALALPTLEWCIAGVGPTVGIVAVGLGRSKKIDVRKHCIKRERNTVIPSDRIEGAVFIAFRRCTVITHDNHDRVVEFTDCFEMIEHPTNVVIGVSQEAGVDLHHAGIGALLFFGKRCPLLNPLWARREFSSRWKDAEIELALMGCGTPFIPAHIEFAGIAIDVRTRRLMRGMTSARSEVEEEGFVDGDVAQIVNEFNCPASEIFSEVVAVLGSEGLLNKVVIGNEVGCILIRFGAHESVEALESATKRPALT
ncbi:unannotated protein [freshwater metagenome]|uniref:Unannotated protein n=1 Tax=freshwater metagenome TaxID=449393 RepID=A0A6J6NLT3_9ZZZZ